MSAVCSRVGEKAAQHTGCLIWRISPLWAGSNEAELHLYPLQKALPCSMERERQSKTILQGTFRDLKHHRTDKAAANTWLERQHNSNYYKVCPVVAVVTPNITTTRKCSVNTLCRFQELSDTSLNVLLFRMSLHHHFSPTKLASPAVASSSRGSSSWRCI